MEETLLNKDSIETAEDRIKKSQEKARVLRETLDNLPETLKLLNEYVLRLGEKIEKMQEPPMEPLKEEVKTNSTKKKRNSDPIPPDFSDIVRNTLNKNFTVELFSRTDAPLMELHIVVPDKYSTMTVEAKEMVKRDIRTRVISYAEGVNGVREFAEKVYNSFTPEYRSQIVADRIL